MVRTMLICWCMVLCGVLWPSQHYLGHFEPVNLLPLFLGSLKTKRLTSTKSHFSPKNDNCPSWIGGIAVEIISWSISTNVMWLRWNSNSWPLDLQSDALKDYVKPVVHYFHCHLIVFFFCFFFLPDFLLFFPRYESCDWGWKDSVKREEMTEDKAWYLIARDQDKKPVAFVHFRFDLEVDQEVLYWYDHSFFVGNKLSWKVLRTDMSRENSVDAEQSVQGLHCLPFCLHL